MTDIDDRAISPISNLKMKTRKSLVKEIFDKSTFNPESFKQSDFMGNWGDVYAQNFAEGMYTSFVTIREKALNHISPKKFSSAKIQVACLLTKRGSKLRPKRSVTRLTLTAIRMMKIIN